VRKLRYVSKTSGNIPSARGFNQGPPSADKAVINATATSDTMVKTIKILMKTADL
jgi:hypothetical protein